MLPDSPATSPMPRRSLAAGRSKDMASATLQRQTSQSSNSQKKKNRSTKAKIDRRADVTKTEAMQINRLIQQRTEQRREARIKAAHAAAEAAGGIFLTVRRSPPIPYSLCNPGLAHVQCCVHRYQSTRAISGR